MSNDCHYCWLNFKARVIHFSFSCQLHECEPHLEIVEDPLHECEADVGAIADVDVSGRLTELNARHSRTLHQRAALATAVV